MAQQLRSLVEQAPAGDGNCLCPPAAAVHAPSAAPHWLSRTGRAAVKGIAQLVYPGGGIVLPARSAYERQVLVEHVAHRARRSTVVRLDLDGRRWSITADASVERPECGKCLRRVSVAGTSAAVTGVYCLLCLIGLPVSAAQTLLLRGRAVG